MDCCQWSGELCLHMCHQVRIIDFCSLSVLLKAHISTIWYWCYKKSSRTLTSLMQILCELKSFSQLMDTGRCWGRNWQFVIHYWLIGSMSNFPSGYQRINIIHRRCLDRSNRLLIPLHYITLYTIADGGDTFWPSQEACPTLWFDWICLPSW